MAFVFVPEMLSGIISATAGVVSALTSIASLIVSIIALEQQGHVSAQDHAELNALLWEVQMLQYEVHPHYPSEDHQSRIEHIMNRVQHHHSKYGHHLDASSRSSGARKSSRSARQEREYRYGRPLGSGGY